MANTKVTSLTPYTGYPASNDKFPFVDVSDSTMAATGTTKYLEAQYILFQNGGTASIGGSFTAPTFYGGTASGGTVNINSTSHTTKGIIRLGTALVLNEATNAGTANGAMTVTGTFTPSGQIGSTWTSLSYGSGWGNLGSGFQTGAYKKVGDLVILRGIVTRTSGSSTTIATLPSGFRPTATSICTVSANGAYGAVNIDSSGVISLSVGSPWISLDNIVFSTL